jgi:hypothetical protein
LIIMAETGYDPNRSRVSDDKMADFLRSPITGDLQEIPGVGPAAVRNLAEGEGGSITNTFQLIGQFLKLRNDEGDCVAHCDTMWQWLAAKGLNAHRSGIVRCLAEKCDTMMFGIYDPTVFGDGDEDDG